MSINEDDRFDEAEGLDLTSEPSSYAPNVAKTDTQSETSRGNLTHVQVNFRCCKVYWRYPIPADILSGAKESWFVYCPRCGSKLRLP